MMRTRAQSAAGTWADNRQDGAAHGGHGLVDMTNTPSRATTAYVPVYNDKTLINTAFRVTGEFRLVLQ